MAFERKKKVILEMVGEAFEAVPKFKEVQYHVPVPGNEYPNAMLLPSIHLDRAIESLSGLTNISKQSEFGIEIIGTVESTDKLALVKCEIEEDIEEIVYGLIVNDAFRAVATQIHTTSVDATPYALMPLGARVPVLPPFGIVRVTAIVTFSYSV